jgi:Holliday junction DNA helicase RuvA
VIGSLRGTVIQRGPDFVLLDVHGVGYQVTVGARTLAQLGGPAESLLLYTYTYVREDALALYGFLRSEELAFFKQLLSVKGIGPKAGLAILSRAELKVLTRAILQEDAALLATVPGIGPKTAARLVLELKGKLRAELFAEDEARPARAGDGEVVAQALQVLTGLGFSPAEAKDAVRKVSAGNGGHRSVEELVTGALRGLDRG